MELMTAEERKELGAVKNAKMIRQGVYDIGILIATVLLADQVGELLPQYKGIAFGLGVGMWVAMLISRYYDWKSVDRLEKALTRDELKRESGHEYSKDELKNLGLD